MSIIDNFQIPLKSLIGAAAGPAVVSAIASKPKYSKITIIFYE